MILITPPPEGILDPRQPYWPADRVGEITWLRLKGRLTGRSVPGLSENFTSYVKLGDADANRLIENIKKYGQYPQVNQNDKYGGAYNQEQYQKWLVEEFLEKPFRQQVDEKIEKAQSFFGGSTSFRTGKTIGVKTTKISGIIPKRRVPTEVISKLSSPIESSSEESVITRPMISSLGRLTLDLETVSNNLDAIKEIIEEDYKNTQQTNKKEAEEFRKRIANRGRIFGKKELGDKKSDVLGTVKKYVGSFFSGTGGAIRALALFKLLQGILSGDPSKIIGPLLGIGMTYLPAIGAGIAGAIVTSLTSKLFGGALGGRAAAAGAGAGIGMPKMGKFGRFAGGAALLGGGLALASNMFGQSGQEGQQDRLEQLTEEQKGLVASRGLGPIPQDELKRFENLNRRFEAALNVMMGRQGRGGQDQQGQSAGPTPQGSPAPGNFQGSSGSEQAMNYFMSQGMTKEQAAGIVGNLMQESTAALDPMANNGSHRGIAQWDRNRWGQFERWAAANGLDVNTREAQLQWVMQEMNTGSGGLGIQRYRQTRTADEAAALFLKDYERSGEQPGSVGYENRIRNARGLVAGTQTSPSVVSTPTPVAAQPRRARTIPAPAATTPNVTLVPISSPANTSTASGSSGGNSTVPNIDTTYSENFLSLYSRLMYQVV